MKNIYPKMYTTSRQLSLKTNKRIEIMADIINSLKLNRVNILDIGCYDGTLLSLIKNKKNNLYGLDASDHAVEKCRRKKIKIKQFFLNDQEKIPFKSNFFDLIIAGEIIEHIYDTDFFLEEISRLLKPNGYLLISTPNIASLGRRLLLLLGISPLIEISPNQKNSSGHIRYFTFQTLRKLLEEHKFSILLKKSDVVNFNNRGSIYSKTITKVFPALGQSIIYLTQK